jgi:hypothetical protein
MKVEKKKNLTTQDKASLVNYLKLYLNVFTKLQRRIWKFLQRFRCDHKLLFMSTKYIAMQCGCCIRTVQSATKLFVSMGLLSKVIRNYATNIYDIPELYLFEKLTTFKRCEENILILQQEEEPEYPPTKKVFLERKLHPFCTLSSLSTNFEKNTHIQDQKKGLNPEIEYILKNKTRIPESEWHKFNKFAPYIMIESLQEAEWMFRKMHKKGESIRNMVNFLLKICWKRQKRQKVA